MFNLAITGGYHYDKYGMPGALTLANIQSVERTGSIYPLDYGRTSDFYVTATPEFFIEGDNTQLEFSLFNSFRKRNSKGVNMAWGGAYETVHHVATYDLSPKVDFSIDTESIDNKLVAGLDWHYVQDDVLSGNRWVSQDQVDIKKNSLGMYFKNNITLFDRFLANFGARGEWVAYDFDQKAAMVYNAEKSMHDMSLECGTGYKLTDTSLLYFSYARAFRFPNTEEYFQSKTVWGGGLNTGLKHQTSNSFELGWKYNTNPLFDFNVAAFLMDVKNEIYYDPVTYTNSNYGPKVRHMGMEFEVQGNLLDGKVKPFSTYTIQEATFKGGTYSRNQVPLVPKSKLVAGVTIKPLDCMQWTTKMQYLSARYKISDMSNQVGKLESYVTFDTKVDVTFKNVTVWGAVNNLLDTEYYAYGVTNAAGTTENFYPAAERTFEVGMTLKY